MERLDESVKEEADGIHNSLGELAMLKFMPVDSEFRCHEHPPHDTNSLLAIVALVVVLWHLASSSSVASVNSSRSHATSPTISRWLLV